MPTEKQFEASRLNGGTVTDDASARPHPPDSQTRSSLSDQEKRRRLANSVCFPAECKEEFLELLRDYRQSLQPVGFLEERVVENITVCDWYRRRYWVLGMAKVAHATVLQEQSADALTNAMHREMPPVQTALAVSKLADNGRALEFFRRCDSSYSRENRHARQELKELQTARLKREHLERLERPPDFDIASCFVHTDDLAEEAIKYSQRTEPNPETSATDVQSWEPCTPGDEVVDELPVQLVPNAAIEMDPQPVVSADTLPEPPPVVPPEKNAERTEPNFPFRGGAANTTLAFDVTSSSSPSPTPSAPSAARVPLLISCRGNIADQNYKVNT
jgi:hypothetical protein